MASDWRERLRQDLATGRSRLQSELQDARTHLHHDLHSSLRQTYEQLSARDILAGLRSQKMEAPVASGGERSGLCSLRSDASPGATVEHAGPCMKVSYQPAPALNAALLHSGNPAIRNLHIRNAGNQTVSLQLAIHLAPEGYVAPYHRSLPPIPSGQDLHITGITLTPFLEALARLDERISGQLTLAISGDHDWVGNQARPIHAYDEWVHDPKALAGLCPFIRPNDPSLSPLIAACSERLARHTGNGALAGYQMGGAERVLAMCQALLEAQAHDLRIGYINPPASFEMSGQKIRRHGRVITDRRGTCLDLAVLQAAALEHMGLYPAIIIVDGHAFGGVWTSPNHLAQPSLDQEALPSLGRELLGALSRLEFLPINSTTACDRPDLELAVDEALNYIRQASDTKTLRLIDVVSSRQAGFTPLPL